MRLSTPRIAPVELDRATPEQREVLEPFAGGVGLLNIFRTMARTPKALKRFNVWGGYILGRGTSLAPRERELVILRTGWRCRSGSRWPSAASRRTCVRTSPLPTTRRSRTLR